MCSTAKVSAMPEIASPSVETDPPMNSRRNAG
jgi:hypothetical protein